MKRVVLACLVASSVFWMPSEIWAQKKTEQQKRMDEMRAELVRARESLHEAHRELADKAEKIRKIEADLKRKPGSKRNSELKKAVTMLEQQLKAMKLENEKLSFALAERDKAIAAAKEASPKNKIVAKADQSNKKQVEAPSSGKAPKKTVSETPSSKKEKGAKVFRLQYALNSAANLEERGRALQWAMQQLEGDPKRRLEIQGFANDRPYETPNIDIANNRAQFLAAYFRTNGIAAGAIVTQPGLVSEEEGEDGRCVKISVITN